MTTNILLQDQIMNSMRNLFRLAKYAAIVIACLVLFSFFLPYNPEDLYGTNSTDVRNLFNSVDGRDSKKLFVILVTGFRTGSTFLGELLNQNNEFLYLFEPFHQSQMRNLAASGKLDGVTSQSSLLEQRTAFLHQLIEDCKIEAPMFASMAEGMKCGTPEVNIERFGSPECTKGQPNRWANTCRRKDSVALKLIRLQRIAHLDLVPGISEANIKIIHLIRDPRGTMNSRLGFGTFYLDDIENLKVRPLTPEKMEIAAANLCDREWENLEFSENLPDYLKGRYMRMTHDEMSLMPIESAEKVYKFLGKEMPGTMNDFLVQHTTHQEKGVLGTSKDSKAVLEKWKSKLDLDIVRAIERKCKKVMDFMGYDPYN